MPDICMPSLGADMTEGSLVEWLVQPGDTVVKGQPIAVVDTAKKFTAKPACAETPAAK